MAHTYFGPRQLLDAGIAITLAKREYELHPKRRRAILQTLKGHPLLRPHLRGLEKRFAKLEREIITRFGKKYRSQLENERESETNPVAVTKQLRIRLEPEEAREWLFLDQPRKAHLRGIRPLSGEDLKKYRQKRKRDPPAFRPRNLSGGVHLTLRPWGVHFAFEDKQDYEGLFLKGSAGVARPNPSGIQFSYGQGVRIPKEKNERTMLAFFGDFDEHERISRHELDHGFFHSLFTDNRPLLRAALLPDHQPIVSRIPKFLNPLQRNLVEENVAARISQRGPWALRNELHSHLTHTSIVRDEVLGQLVENPDRSPSRWKIGVYELPAQRLMRTQRLLKRLLGRKEFVSLSEDEKREVMQWASEEKKRIRGHLKANLTAIRESPIPTSVLGALAMLVPFHKIARAVKAMDKTYARNRSAYDEKMKGTHLGRGGFMERLFQLEMEQRRN